MTQSLLSQYGPVGLQQEVVGPAGMVRTVLGSASSATSALMLATDRNVRYVDKGGNDATGDGSRVNPFLTIQPAVNACAALATATDPFVVRVSPGTYASTFTLAPNVYVVGSGSGAQQYNGTPLRAATVLAPVAAQALGAAFAGAGVKATGLLNCALSTALVCNFAAIGSTGEGTLLLDDVLTESAITITGNGAAALNAFTARGLYVNNTVDVTITDIPASTLIGYSSDFGGLVRYNQAAAIQGFHLLSGAYYAGPIVTWTSAAIGNFISVTMTNSQANQLNQPGSVVGVGAQVIAFTTCNILMPDAASRISFGDNAAATLLGVNGAQHIVRCTPTADRVLTIDRPRGSSLSTLLRVHNLSTAFNIDLVFPAGTVQPGSPSYVPPGSMVEIVYAFSGDLWSISPFVQAGSTTLVNGVSANIPADISLTKSRIVVTQSVTSGAFGTAIATGRVAGTRAGGGLFIITSILPATGATVTTDQGTYDWHVVNQGG